VLPRLDLLLRGLTVLSAAVAMAALLWRPAVPSVEVPLAGLETAPAPHAPLATTGPAAAQAIIEANIFSASRVAPRTRYNPLASDSEDVAPPVYDSAIADTTAMGGEAVPQLYGVVLGPGGATALMRLDASVPDAQLYREGERAGGYRVLKISEGAVTLAGPRGRIVLRLIRSEGGP
jgi:hypothetical protein